MTKYCKKCDTTKDVKYFSKQKASKDNLQNRCKSCMYAYKEEMKDSRGVTLQKLRSVLKKYGLTFFSYSLLLIRCDNRCEMCGVLGSSERAGRLCIDHDHITGKVRGLLCNDCNSGLGLLKDSPKVLQSAIHYLTARGNYSSLNKELNNEY